MAQLSIVEIKDERGRDRQSALAREGERILKQAGTPFILLDERGAGLSSLEFADLLRGRDTHEFVLGGPFGVSEEVRRRAGTVVSLSRMTIPHEMARLVLLEQLFRVETILRGKDYHH
jgi:23S rRNA (pseudouridine1915-N3)-methyltransferase